MPPSDFEVLPPGYPGMPPARRKRSGLGGVLLAIGAFALKFGFLALKSLKTVLSMALMIWVYSWAFGWRFSVGIVLLIFVHEMGHVLAAKWLGIPVSAPLFIPFIGASIIMKQNPRDAWTEALMAYGGPLAGGLGGWACLIASQAWDLPWLTAIASFTFVMNLFNLIPVPPLDGGRICAAVSPWFWTIGLVLLAGSIFFFHAWNSLFIIIIIVVVAIPRLKSTFFGPRTPEMQRYYNVPFADRIFMASFYVGLILALLLGYWDASEHLRGLWSQHAGMFQ